MRIGIDCRMFGSQFTGIGRYTYELVQYFIETNSKQPKPNTIVLFFNEPQFSDFQTDNPHVEKVLVNAKHYSLAEQVGYLRKLYVAKLDHMHFTHFNVPLLYRRDYTVTIHDLTLTFFPGKKMTKWYYRAAYHAIIKNALHKAKKIVAVSQNTKRDLLQHFNLSQDQIEVIYNGVSPHFRIVKDENAIAQTLKKLKISRPFLLYTGVWRSHKNLPRLIEAFHRLKTEQDFPAQLVITGKEDPYYPEVRETAHKLEADVVFPGLVSEKELVHLYNAAALYVYPSLYEGFGLPPLEALSCGTPIVCSNKSSLPEVCGDKTALFFAPHDTKEMAQQIHTLYNDKEMQAKFLAAAPEHLKQFTWKKSATQTYEFILSQCLNHSKNS